jgi:hypothetical protein
VFQRFDLGKIGTGEGAQMYGKGLYTAQDQEVAKRFTPRDIKFEDALMKRYNQAEKAGDYTSMQVYEDFLTQKTPEEIAKNFKDMGFVGKDLMTAQKAFDTAKNLYQQQTVGNLYKVDLPDTHIRRMLDWDAPIKEQPMIVRKLAKSMGVDMNDLGGDLLAKVGKDEAGRKIMQDAGIRGVKYLDEKSRFSPHEVSIAVKGKPYASNQFLTKEQAEKYAAEKKAEGFETAYKNVGTKNFVVFDPNHMTILERNNQVIK